jgi:hypothetical protein
MERLGRDGNLYWDPDTECSPRRLCSDCEAELEARLEQADREAREERETNPTGTERDHDSGYQREREAA